MAGFSGTFYGKLDSKNRLSLPAKLRQSSESSLEVAYLTLGINECLFLYPSQEWRKIQIKLDRIDTSDEDEVFVMRYLMLNTHEINPDTQGRFQIPTELSDKVGITRDVRLLGLNRRVEIWCAERLDEYVAEHMSDSGKNYQTLLKKILL